MKMYDPEIWKNENNGYEELVDNIKKTFASKLKDNVKTPLFRTSVSDLFDTFLYYLPDACKQEYTCRACGVGYSKDKEWNLIVKVTTGNIVKMIKIDRFD